MDFFEEVDELVEVDHGKVLWNVLGVEAYYFFFEIRTIDVNGYFASAPAVVGTQLFWIELKGFRRIYVIRIIVFVKRRAFLEASKCTIVTQFDLFALSNQCTPLRVNVVFIILTNFFDTFDDDFFDLETILILICKDYRLYRYHLKINLTVVIVLVE